MIRFADRVVAGCSVALQQPLRRTLQGLVVQATINGYGRLLFPVL